LLAEDNAVNQELTRIMLESMGCRVTLAEDGLAAVQAMTGGRYDLVLMDCQMPLMDGYKATRAIRAAESATNARRTPIVALSAHAIGGDREACLDAGMDDYLSKPFKQSQLATIVARWMPAFGGGAAGPGAPRVSDVPAHLELSALRQIRRTSMSGPVDFLTQVIDLFVDQSPVLLRRIREAIVVSDRDGLRAAAHALRSSSSYLGAVTLAALSKELEECTWSATLERAPSLLASIESEFAEVDALLKNAAARAAIVDA
jgi:CheY-like chemotaxis protein